MTTAIVVGASLAGLCAARALADHADHVLVVDRDDLPTDASTRRGVPQGRHAHALLKGGELAIEAWFPGIIDELVNAGAQRSSLGLGHWWQDGGLKLSGDFGGSGTSMTRPLFEGTVRTRLAATDGVEIRGNAAVDSLLGDGQDVRGAVVDGEAIEADIVVDSSGRNSRLVDLVDHGDLPISRIHIGVSYGTRLLRRSAGDLPDDAPYAVVAPTPPAEPRGAVLLPVEGDRWILTLAGMHGDAVPSDDEGYLEFARSLPTPAIADIVESAEALSPVMTYKYPHSQRRHFEKADRHPVGYVGIGDVVCSFNPIYGQGMSSAALQAVALDHAVGRYGLRSAELGRRFSRAAAKVVDNPWQIAGGADFLHPSTTGDKAPGTDLVNRYVHHVQRATHVSRPVLERMIEVQSLLRPPTSLMSPRFVGTVLRASRRAADVDRSAPRRVHA